MDRGPRRWVRFLARHLYQRPAKPTDGTGTCITSLARAARKNADVRDFMTDVVSIVARARKPVGGPSPMLQRCGRVGIRLPLSVERIWTRLCARTSACATNAESSSGVQYVTDHCTPQTLGGPRARLRPVEADYVRIFRRPYRKNRIVRALN